FAGWCELRDSGPACRDGLDVEARPYRRHDEGSFRGIALDHPPVALSFQERVIAQDSAFQETPQARVRGWVRGAAIRLDRPLGVESFPADFARSSSRDEDSNVHLPVRWRPGLV